MVFCISYKGRECRNGALNCLIPLRCLFSFVKEEMCSVFEVYENVKSKLIQEMGIFNIFVMS